MEAASILSKVELYRDAAGDWRWRAISLNNVDILADSGQGYANHVDALSVAARLFPATRIDDPLQQVQPSQPA